MAIILIRTIVIYAALLFCMRVMGKRQLGELELSELVVSVLVADLASLPLQDVGLPLINGLVAIFTLFCLELILSGLILHSSRFRSALFGKPCFLIEKGVINQREMVRNRFTVEELTEQLRRQSVTDLSTVDYAVLETDGTLSVLLSAASQPATAGQLGCRESGSGYPYILICDGRTLTENLARCARDEAWLREECSRRGAASPRDVFLFTCTPEGAVYFAAREDKR